MSGRARRSQRMRAENAEQLVSELENRIVLQSIELDVARAEIERLRALVHDVIPFPPDDPASKRKYYSMPHSEWMARMQAGSHFPAYVLDGPGRCWFESRDAALGRKTKETTE